MFTVENKALLLEQTLKIMSEVLNYVTVSFLTEKLVDNMAILEIHVGHFLFVRECGKTQSLFPL